MRRFLLALTVAGFSAAASVSAPAAADDFLAAGGAPANGGAALRHDRHVRGCEKDLATKNCAPPKTPTLGNTETPTVGNTDPTNSVYKKQWDIIQNKIW